MPEWMLMVTLATKVMFVGPFATESECHSVRRIVFYGKTAICVEETRQWRISR